MKKMNITVNSNEYLVCLPRAIVTLCHVCSVSVRGFTSLFFLKTAYLNRQCFIFLGRRWMSRVIVQLTSA